MLLQLYNEEVHDLLSSDQTKLQIHESKESGIYVAGLREDIVTSAEHVLQLLYSGEKLRHFGETKMNKTSSRSHTIFRMVSTTCCILLAEAVTVRLRIPRLGKLGSVWITECISMCAQQSTMGALSSYCRYPSNLSGTAGLMLTHACAAAIYS